VQINLIFSDNVHILYILRKLLAFVLVRKARIMTSRKSKHKQCNGQKKKTNIVIQNSTQKTKDRATRSLLKLNGELGCSDKVSSVCSTCGTCHRFEFRGNVRFDDIFGGILDNHCLFFLLQNENKISSQLDWNYWQ